MEGLCSYFKVTFTGPVLRLKFSLTLDTYRDFQYFLVVFPLLPFSEILR